MFEYKYNVTKKEDKSTYGSIGIRNVYFGPEEIEAALPGIIFDDANLKFMFAEKELSIFKRKNVYGRFIPRNWDHKNLEKYVEESVKKNKSFYSFLAEGILALVYRDLYKYELSCAVIDIRETVKDSHTGVDACMYNLASNTIVLGEAKFYESLKGGMNQIIDDFINKDISNKLESLQIKANNDCETSQIIIKNLGNDHYCSLSIEEFMQQKITFAGFVLHSESDVSKYDRNDFYDSYLISVQKLKDNINKSLGKENISGDYEIVLVHLPIKDKKSLISKVIDIATKEISKL